MTRNWLVTLANFRRRARSSALGQVGLAILVGAAAGASVTAMTLIAEAAHVAFYGIAFDERLSAHARVAPIAAFLSLGLGGLAMGRPLLPVVLDSVLQLTDAGWRILTLRWGLFFFFLAGLNELVWRTQTTDFWVTFKVFGTMPITILFALSQVPLILKHEVKTEPGEEPAEHW